MIVGLIGFGYWGKIVNRNIINSNLFDEIFIFDKYVKSNSVNGNLSIENNEEKFFKKKIDLFIITTPTSTHLKFLEKCLKLNKYVCVTKPITANLNEIIKIKKKYKNIHKIFLDHTYLFHSSIKYINNLIKKKSLGNLIYYDSERISFGKFYKDVDVIDDLAIHDLYILDYFLKGQMPNKITVNTQNNFGNKNFLSNISLNYPSGFFANIKVSWYSPKKSRRVLLAGDKKMLEFDDNESDQKIKIYNKGIEYHSNKDINQWLYRTGSILIPNIEHKESLQIMIKEFYNYAKKRNKTKIQFQHALRVMKVLNEIKRKI